MTAPHIRPFGHTDYEAFAAINNAIYPQHPTSAEDERAGDVGCNDGRLRSRWAVEDAEGQMVGTAEARQMDPVPSRFELEIYVHPSRQGQGFGKALYNHLMSELAPLEPVSLHVDEVKEDLRGLRFLADRGFKEVMRWWGAWLDVQAFDPAPFTVDLERVRSKGVVIRSLRELASHPERDRRLYDLTCDVSPDVPSVDPYTPPSFEDYRRELPRATSPDADTYFVAVQNDLYVGLHIVVPAHSGTDHLRTAMTGVRRTHRRQGIALALKLHGIAYAKEHGHPVIRTMNATGNDGIIAVNARLGFARQAAWIKMVKTLAPQTSSAG